MRQLLIVDDELIAVEGLKSGVRWEEIGISRLFTAFSPSQAKEIFQANQVDILLCDIEMPQGTGLELLEWVRQHYPATETIFLTSHADFQYAKQAIQLGSLDYLLKPIPYRDVEEAVKRAITKLDQESKLSEFSQYGKYWVQHQPLLVERFWLDILNQSIPSVAKAIGIAAEERNIPYSQEMTFLPVFIHIRRWHKKITIREEKIMEYAIRKSAEEIVLNELESGLLITLGDSCMLALLRGELEDMADKTKLRSACETFTEACQTYFYAGVTCYIGEITQGHHMAEMVLKLRRLDSNNVAHDEGVFSLQDAQSSLHGSLPHDMGLWAVLLKEGTSEQLLKATESYIHNLVLSNQLNSELLHQFVQDFQQMVYYELQVKGIQAHHLFGDEASKAYYTSATRSATDALVWIAHIVDKSISFLSTIDQSQSVTDKVKAYIHEHLAEDLSREEIANYVYLNPDYLTRIFKKETGMSVSDYVLQQRLGMAAGLLVNTEMSVSTIASKVGYANFSHFSRMFKKYMELNPMEYRSTYQQERPATESRESDRDRS